VQAAYRAQDYPLLEKVFTQKIAASPNDAQLRTNLAVVYQQMGQTGKAVEVLQQAAQDIPSFKDQAQGFIDDLKAGRIPGQSSQPTVSVQGHQVQSVTTSQ
jgi:tetratricopeptide (TPR) repeat protein